MEVGAEPEFQGRGVGQAAVVEAHEAGAGEEDEGEGEVVGPEAQAAHAVVEGEGEGVVVPRGGEGADHDVEGVVVGVRGDVGEEVQGVREVVEVDELGEEVVGLVEVVVEHLGVDLLECGGGGALFEEGEEESFE